MSRNNYFNLYSQSEFIKQVICILIKVTQQQAYSLTEVYNRTAKQSFRRSLKIPANKSVTLSNVSCEATQSLTNLTRSAVKKCTSKVLLMHMQFEKCAACKTKHRIMNYSGDVIYCCVRQDCRQQPFMGMKTRLLHHL